jgi:hypothetical protein
MLARIAEMIVTFLGKLADRQGLEALPERPDWD